MLLKGSITSSLCVLIANEKHITGSSCLLFFCTSSYLLFSVPADLNQTQRDVSKIASTWQFQSYPKYPFPTLLVSVDYFLKTECSPQKNMISASPQESAANCQTQKFYISLFLETIVPTLVLHFDLSSLLEFASTFFSSLK